MKFLIYAGIPFRLAFALLVASIYGLPMFLIVLAVKPQSLPEYFRLWQEAAFWVVYARKLPSLNCTENVQDGRTQPRA